MGKNKSDADLLREQFFQREARRRAALKGPFRCPKCLGDNKLQCHVTRKDVKEPHTSISGKTSTIIASYSHYQFTCPVCKFKKRIVRRTSKYNHIVDIYSDLYDEELSTSQRQGQIGLVSDRSYKILRLPRHTVRMK